MGFLRKLKTFTSLPSAERRIFFQALGLLPVMALRIQFSTIKNTFAWLRDRSGINENSFLVGELALSHARRIIWLMGQAMRYSPIKGKCLSQSLVLWFLLRRSGIQSDLRVGFNKDTDNLPVDIDNFNAHAWVECQGVVLNDHPDVYERYVVFDGKIQPPG